MILCWICVHSLTQGWRLAQPAAGPAGRDRRCGLAAAQVLSLPGQESDGEAVGEQHHAQRYIEADNGADQLVDRIRYLTSAIHQHRGMILSREQDVKQTENGER